jgi:hypothetical protein
MSSPFIYGKTRNCCKCYALATNWSGWLRKGRDGIVAGFCDEHRVPPNIKQTYGSHNLRGIFNKNMDAVEGNAAKKLTEKFVRIKLGLDINVIEQ